MMNINSLWFGLLLKSGTIVIIVRLPTKSFDDFVGGCRLSVVHTLTAVYSNLRSVLFTISIESSLEDLLPGTISLRIIMTPLEIHDNNYEENNSKS
jgi:hypothetical protein